MVAAGGATPDDAPGTGVSELSRPGLIAATTGNGDEHHPDINRHRAADRLQTIGTLRREFLRSGAHAENYPVGDDGVDRNSRPRSNSAAVRVVILAPLALSIAPAFGVEH